jgi:hypothetical protein
MFCSHVPSISSGSIIKCIRPSAVEPVTCPSEACTDTFFDSRRLMEHIRRSHCASDLGDLTAKSTQEPASLPESSGNSNDVVCNVSDPSCREVSQDLCDVSASPSHSQLLDPTFAVSAVTRVDQRIQSSELLDGSRTYLLSNDAFEYLGIRYHKHYKTIHCVCEQAVLPDAIVSHVHGHGIKVTREMRRKLEDHLQKVPLVKAVHEVMGPSPNGPPVELLRLVDGHRCVRCPYAAPAVKSVQNHWHKTHGKVETVAPKDRYTKAMLQTFFAHVGQNYFEVNPALATLSPENVFAIYMRDHVPNFPAFPASPPLTEREVPPLLQVTQWHEHLAAYVSNAQTRQNLLSMISLTSSSTAPKWLKKAGEICYEYLKDVRAKANRATLAMRMLLMECPRYVLPVLRSFFLQ